MIKQINKLVRDNIPEIIQADCRFFEIEIMEELEYKQALLNKLIEEANEVATANSDTLGIEISDLLEVIDAILKVYELSKDDIIVQQIKRAARLGTFTKRIKLTLLETQDD